MDGRGPRMVVAENAEIRERERLRSVNDHSWECKDSLMDGPDPLMVITRR